MRNNYDVEVSAIFFLALPAQARVFDINSEKLAGYFALSGGNSLLDTHAVQDEAPGSVNYSGGVKYSYSGEFGMIYTQPRVSLRFGLEILRPMLLETKASSSSTELYSATSDILGYAPKLSVELNLHGNRISRSYVSLGIGAGNINLQNEYKLTADGRSTYSGIVDHEIEAKGSATLLSAALGYEEELADTTTFTFEIGYRQFKVENLAYSKNVTTFNGSKQAGDKVQTVSGKDRELDFSGAYVALGFRFYL